MNQVRQTAEALLKQSGIQITRDGDILPLDAPVATSPFGSETDENAESFDDEELENQMREVSQTNRIKPQSKLL
jgi:hypothetical protein